MFVVNSIFRMVRSEPLWRVKESHVANFPLACLQLRVHLELAAEVVAREHADRLVVVTPPDELGHHA